MNEKTWFPFLRISLGCGLTALTVVLPLSSSELLGKSHCALVFMFPVCTHPSESVTPFRGAGYHMVCRGSSKQVTGSESLFSKTCLIVIVTWENFKTKIPRSPQIAKS